MSAVEQHVFSVLTHLHFLLKSTVHLKNGSNIFHHSILVKKLRSKNAIHIRKIEDKQALTNRCFSGPPILQSHGFMVLEFFHCGVETGDDVHFWCDMLQRKKLVVTVTTPLLVSHSAASLSFVSNKKNYVL